MKKLILYDFDGVIVDSFPISFGILREKNPNITEQDYRDCFLGNFYEEEMRGRPDIVWGAPEEFFSKYADKLMSMPPVPGMVPVIQELAKEFTQVIVTSTINSPVQEYLKTYKLDQYFEAVLGKEDGHSKTEKIQTAVARFEGDVKNALFITDTLGDLKEANRAGVRSIAVTWGFHDRETLEKGSPFAVVVEPQELISAVRGMFV
jgi:phosphoglycolate phosphatase